MGLVARAAIHAVCGGIAQNLGQIGARFTAPVFPGETIRSHIWQQGDILHFHAEAVERGQRVIDSGFAKITTTEP